MRSYIPKQTRSSSMKSTITDIARETGLSVSTISKYLNQKPVRPENARLIEEAIHRMDYTPNPIAQGLRSKKARMAALVIPPLGNELWGRIIYPIEDVLRAHGYMTVVCTASVDASKNNTAVHSPCWNFFQTTGSMVLSPLAALCQVP